MGRQHVALVISPDELQRAADVLLESGAIVERPIEDGDGRSLYFHDPDGNVIELRTRVNSAPMDKPHSCADYNHVSSVQLCA